MEVSIIGYYGANFGDILMLKNLVTNVKLKYDVINIFTYGNKDELKNRIEMPAEKYSVTIYSIQSDLSIFSFYQKVKKSSKIIWGGGTCFMDQKGTGGLKYMLIAKLAKVPVYYLGIGIDKHKKIMTKAFIILSILIAKTIVYRDPYSFQVGAKYNFLKKKNLDLMLDLALSDYSAPHTTTCQAGNHLVFCTRNIEGYFKNPVTIHSSLLRLADQICLDLKISKIIILISDFETDRRDSDEAAAYFQGKGYCTELIDGGETGKTIQSILSASFVLSVRLHPALIAAKNSIPFALFNYSDKNKKMLQDINQLSRLVTEPEMFVPVYSKPEYWVKTGLQEKTEAILKNI